MIKKLNYIFIFIMICTITPLYADQIDQELEYLLSDKPTMDYNDPKLKNILSASKSNIIAYYKAFIEYDQSQKKSEDIAKAKKILLEASKLKDLNYSSFHYDFKKALEANVIDEQIIDLFFSLLASPYLFQEHIPLWLVLKHPNILNYNNERRSPTVNASYTVDDMPAFEKLETIVGRTIAEYWSAPHGSIILDIGAYNKNLREKMSFAPQLITQNTDTVEET